VPPLHLRAHALSAAVTGQDARDAGAAAPAARGTPWVDAAGIAATAALAFVLYRGAMGLWWLSDDFFNLRYVRSWSPAQYCAEPAVWQRLPFRMLTPLLFVAYDVDLELFGLRPDLFYAHGLLVVALAAIALHLFLRQYLPASWSAGGALLFLAGVPLAVGVVPQVMARHYATSALLVVLAAIAWVRGLRAGSAARGWSLAVASALLWWLAALAKEVALPLVALLPFVPERDVATRLRRLAPHAVAGVLYLAYRRYLMGAWVGGYGWAVEGAAGWLDVLVRLPGRLANEAAGGTVLGWLAVALVVVGCLVLAARRSSRLALAVGALAAVAPVAPVASEVVARYAVVPWLLAVVGFAFGAHRLRHGTWLLAAALVALLCANRQAWSRQLESLTRQSVENRALASLGPGDVVRLPAGPSASFRELIALTRETTGHEGAAWFLDDFYLCAERPIRRLWEYDATTGTVADASGRLGALRRAHCGGLRAGAPLDVAFHFDDDAVLHWRLGPYAGGRWSFVLRDGVDRFDVPAKGAFQLAFVGAFPLRVRYDDPAGWTTYSAVLPLELSGSRRWRWLRPTTRDRGSS
jgi:hypothetical protein